MLNNLNKRDLNNRVIMVLKPAPSGHELCKKINDLGGRAIYFPTIEYGPAPDEAGFLRTIAELDHYDWLIFISAQAVKASMNALLSRWQELPTSLKIAAIGETTAQALKDAGLTIHACPSNWGSEGLLALPEFQDVAYKKILIVRGGEGRELLAETLTERGADIRYLEAYQRRLPQYESAAMLPNLKELDAIVCTSYESIVNLTKLLTEKDCLQLKTIPLVVVSERIKNLAQKIDFQTIWVAWNAGDHAILKTLSERGWDDRRSKDRSKTS